MALPTEDILDELSRLEQELRDTEGKLNTIALGMYVLKNRIRGA